MRRLGTGAGGVALANLLQTRLGPAVGDQFERGSGSSFRTVTRREHELHFNVPNSVNAYRVDTFATKEPETLDWIDALPSGCTLWDIGANIGLYSCYAAKARNCRVYAFEPSVFNIELLARNIHANGLSDRITLVPIPLTRQRGDSLMRIPSSVRGGALSTFGDQERSLEGSAPPSGSTGIQFSMVGSSMDAVVADCGIPEPYAIKLDVDGIELAILEGGTDVLARVHTVILEVDDAEVDEARAIGEVLQRAGLTFASKRQSAMIASSAHWSTMFNQVWVRE